MRKETKKSVAISIFFLVFIISIVAGEVLIEKSPFTTIFIGTLTNFTELIDTPGAYTGNAGNCTTVNSSATGLEFTKCLTSQTNIFDQSLNTTDNVTFNNITATGSITANCIETDYFIEFTDNAISPNNGFLTLEGNINFQTGYGRKIPFNSTIQQIMIQSRVVVGCSTDPIYKLLVNDVNVANITLPDGERENTTILSPLDVTRLDNFSASTSAWTCLTNPDDVIMTMVMKVRC